MKKSTKIKKPKYLCEVPVSGAIGIPIYEKA